jgi:hypothetical protein
VLAIWSLWPITHTLWPAQPKDGSNPSKTTTQPPAYGGAHER